MQYLNATNNPYTICLMKKSLLFLLLAIPLGVQCQYSQYYYHRTGDTIEHDSPTYFHYWWDWQRYYSTLRVLTLTQSSGRRNGTIMYRHITTDTLKIIGIAGLRPSRPIHGPDDTTALDYLFVFGADPLNKLAQVRRFWWRDTHRKIHLQSNGTIHNLQTTDDYLRPEERLSNCCYNHPWDRYFDVYEYYFDSAITVVDSFYVGSNQSTTDYYDVMEVAWGGEDCEGTACDFLSFHIVSQTLNQTEWTHADIPFGYLVWPIIQIDTTVPPEGICLPLENLRATAIDTFSVSIAWTDVSTVTSQVEIRYGPTATPNANWHTTTVSATTTATIDLPRRDYSDYAIFIRAICQSTKNNSEWSDSLFVSLPRNTPDNPSPTDSLDIHLPSSGNTSITLQPNPATGHTLITSPLPLQHVTLHNTSGALLYSNPAHGLSHALPLDGLPAGSYLVSVRTARGTFVRTLVVK